ncbi:3'-5' exonuclease [Mangrovicoccus sp. HB161399]|uniref:3'-5' exonuclease n=1 Tax=Mangrovicoccus sp. HB161399 TaxID=2720392 RepID=UPI0020A6DAE1|nr:3'-5' exonuclease [Mangrovicoccus sp. HB161399]
MTGRDGTGTGGMRLPQGSFRFVVLDVETASSDPSSICQVGLACVRDGGAIETWAAYVDPACRFSAFNIQLTGIGPETVRGAPRFAVLLPELRGLLDRQPVIQHSSFDRRAIHAACDLAGLPHPGWTWHDSVLMARRAWPEFRGNGGHGLAHLKQRLDLEFEHHDAGEDARATAQVVLMAEARLGCDFRAIAAGGGAGKRRPAAVPDPAGPLAGGRVAFTGRLALDRTEAAVMAAAAGLETAASIGPGLTHLVVADRDMAAPGGPVISGRHRKVLEMQAAGAQVAVMDESAFLALLASLRR